MSAPHPPLLPRHPSTFSAVGGCGGDDGGDDPAKNRPPKSTHEADATARSREDDDENEECEAAAKPKQQQRVRRRRIPEGPLQCPVCGRTFKSAKALHGHMRCHPERNWRGVTPPTASAAKTTAAITVRSGEREAAADSLMLLSAQPQEPEEAGRFRCASCGARFGTRQALGGHRASHRSKIGCYMKGKEGAGSSSGVGGTENRDRDKNNNNNNVNKAAAAAGERRRRGYKKRGSGTGIDEGPSSTTATKTATAADERVEERPRRRRWVVDLNLPPPPEPEDDNKDDDQQSPPPP